MHNASNHNLDASVKEGYEVTDMNARLVMYFIAGLFILIFGSVLTIVVVLRGFDESRPSLNTTPASALAPEGVQVPEKPHLQLNPEDDLKALVETNTRPLGTYGMVSEEPGVERAHIPVEEAMKRVAAGEAPYRQEPAEAVEEMVDPFAEDAL